MSAQQDIETPGPAGVPIVKFRAIGQTLIGALVDAETRQQVKWKDGQPDGPAFKEDGVTPKKERILYILIQPGTTAMRTSTFDPDEYEPLEVGTLARVILKGFKWGQYIDARKETPGLKGEKTGDIISMTYTHGSYTNKNNVRIELHSEADINAVPRDFVIGKDMALTIARPGDDQTAVIDACNAARAERKAQAIDDDEPARPNAPAPTPAFDFAKLTAGQRDAIATASNAGQAPPF